MMGNALAGDLFGGPVFSSNQSIVACEIVNVSNAPVHITSKSIFDKLGVNLSLNGDTCGSTLSAFNVCYYFVSITGARAFTPALSTSSNQMPAYERPPMLAPRRTLRSANRKCVRSSFLTKNRHVNNDKG